LPEVAPQHFRHVRLLDAEQGGCINLLEAALLHEGVDLIDKLCLNEMFVGI
jgi:hypothetical protein